MPATDVAFWVVALLVILALGFDFMNGFHDAANSIATVVSTGVLRPQQAVVFAAFFNFLAIFVFHLSVAATVGKGIVLPAVVDLHVIFGALIGAIVWNVITWYYGIPSSSSHALIGGLVGAALPKAGIDGLVWSGIIKTVSFIFISPFVGFLLGSLMMLLVAWVCKNANLAKTDRWFRRLQLVSAGAYSLGHGGNDAQKTMGVIALSLTVGGFYSGSDTDPIPTWVIVAAASAISFGTYAGGWRIMKTLGHKMIEVDQVKGLASTTVASTVLYVMAIHFKAPISTTHTITSSILGAGATRGRKWVRWGVVGNIATAWVLTLPAAAACAALAYKLIHLFGGN